MKEPQNMTGNEEELWVARSSHEECIDFILEDLDYAIEHLGKDKVAGRGNNKYVAAAFKSRVALYAGSVAVECFGIVGMAAVNMKDGLVKLLRKDSLKHGISVTITEDNRIRLNFHVIVAYGVNISTIADNLVSNVKYKVEDFTGMEIEKINIYVEGVRAID